MKSAPVLIFLLSLHCCLPTFAQEKDPTIDWNAVYEQLLKDPKARKKIEAKGASKEQVIQWLKQRPKSTDDTGKRTATNETQQPIQDWDAAYQKLLQQDPGVREKIERGDATKADVIEWMKQQAKGEGKQKADRKDVRLEQFENKLRELVDAGRLTKKQAEELRKTMTDSRLAKKETDWDAAYEQFLQADPGAKAKVESGRATKEQVIAWLKANRGQANGKDKAGKRMNKTGNRRIQKEGGVANFYAVLVGRLKTKDIELGEFKLDVEHVSSMYGNRWIKGEIVGETVQITGVSGPLLDKLLQIKPGKTLNVRVGKYYPESKTLPVAQKFQVLEEMPPFEPADYGVPPKDFRGFRGLLRGEIVETNGYEILMKVEQVERVAPESKAVDVMSGKGKRVRIVGLYTHKDVYDGLHVGDSIQVEVSHTDPNDEMNVLDVLEKVE
ncbi:MAG: hypothetical protein P8N76_04220 [Pirellulaceae bacterium]|nr:hypothetical protein [Pirellulaceae bacterium]